MTEYLTAGVYVEDFDNGVLEMEGTSTSIAGFIGYTRRGNLTGKPVLVHDFVQYKRIFGGYLSNSYKDSRFLPYSVEQFFNNGGSYAYVMRVASTHDTCASHVLSFEDHQIVLESANQGDWGNKLQVGIQRNYERFATILKDGENIQQYVVQNISGFQRGEVVELRDDTNGLGFYSIEDIQQDTIYLNAPLLSEYSSTRISNMKLYAVQYNVSIMFEDCEEVYTGVSLQNNLVNGLDHMLAKSNLLKVSLCSDKLSVSSYQALNTILTKEDTYLAKFQGGTTQIVHDDPSIFIGKNLGLGKSSGLCAFQEVNDVSIMVIPGITMPEVQSTIIDFCESKRSCIAILDIPQDCASVDEVLDHCANFDSSYATIYHPWLLYFDPLDKCNFYLPPSGVMAGVYSRIDNTIGVHKAPANEMLRGCIGVSISYNEMQRGKLSLKGINLIRRIPPGDIRVWSARTLSSDSTWRYIQLRRLFIYIEESIRAMMNWVVFEPSNGILWSSVEGIIRLFLMKQWQIGALAGTTPDEAFCVIVDKSTMTQDDIVQSRLVCV
ncbi:MAG: phage tail sheath subtilisin-like domain-containing protein, partial [Longicatena sp.]